MAIAAGDIKIVASAVMLDVPEGGGPASSTVIVDGQSNSIFNDISELNRAGGNVSIRKLFATVDTLDTDTYLGANVIVSSPPNDPNVSVTLFSTGDPFDTRDDAKNRIEQFLAPGPEWGGYLLENHVIGQRAIQLLQRVGSVQPSIGQTIVLAYREGEADARTQYVRVTDVTSVQRTFSYNNNGNFIDYLTDVVTLGISDPLRFDFPGSVPSPAYSREVSKTLVRETSVADAASYFGVSETTTPVVIGALSTKVESIFTQLVPSAQVETVLTDVDAAGTNTTLLRVSSGSLQLNTAAPFGPGQGLYLGTAIQPGSISISVGASTLTDVGGQLFDGAAIVGTVDYVAGVLNLAAGTTPYLANKDITFTPSVAPPTISATAIHEITIENRSFNVNLSVNPPPAPGSMQVSYRANGRWYTLRDNGAGVLRGSDSAFGTGTVSYITGTVALTMGALPDVGSAVLYAWGKVAAFTDRSATVVPTPTVVVQLPDPRVVANSLSLVFGGATVVDDVQGALTGDSTGNVDYVAGKVFLTPSTLPNTATAYNTTYANGDIASESSQTFFNPTYVVTIGPTRGNVSMNIGATNVRPGSVRLNYLVNTKSAEIVLVGSSGFSREVDLSRNVTVTDNGIGGLVLDGLTVGSIVYASGAMTFNVLHPIVGTRPIYAPIANWTGPGIYAPNEIVGSVVETYDALPEQGTWNLVATWQVGVSSNAKTPTVSSSTLQFDLTPTVNEVVLPGSVKFNIGGTQYFDRLGAVYRDLDPATGAGLLSGSIDYSSGQVTLTHWPSGAVNSVTIVSLATSQGYTEVTDVSFRIPLSPIRPSSFQFNAIKANGGVLTASANALGVVNAAGVQGKIDYQTGVVNLRFGDTILATGHELEDWYAAAALNLDGTIWRPHPVFADSITYNAVAYTYIPLDSAIIGIDPVRLPQDGRVAIYRPGGFAVIGDSQTTNAFTAVNGASFNIGRTRLSRVRLLGNNNLVINTGYSVNLDTGILTFASVAGYSQPVRIEHRIEDMLQINDVQIDGTLTFSRPITHAYPIGAYVSSALIAGDLKSRVGVLFDQATWDGVTWLDQRDGNASTGTYNNGLSPIIVTNRGAVTERWAILFTSSTAFQVIGEHVGVIGTGNINSTTAIVNPARGVPYFSIDALGWGAGWSVGNVLFFKTFGAQFPFYEVRTVQQGPEAGHDYSFTTDVRGDVDQP